jgi:hypothetical protein
MRLRSRYGECNLSRRPGVYTGAGVTNNVESDVFSCDYNGWADVPEEEREGIDAFEAAGAPIVEHPTQRLLPVRRKEARSWEPGTGSRRAA